MSKLKKFFMAMVAFSVMLFFVGCGKTEPIDPNSPNLPPSSESDLLTDTDVKNILKQSLQILNGDIVKINSFSYLTESDFHSSFNIPAEMEEILNIGLLFETMLKAYEQSQFKTEILYSAKNSSNFKQFSKISVNNIDSKISFTIIEDGFDKQGEIKIFVLDSVLKENQVSVIRLKVLKTDQNGKNLSLFGFEIDVENDLMTLYYGKPSTSLNPIIFVSEDMNDVVWNTCMICHFDFSENADLKYFSDYKIKIGNTNIVPREAFMKMVINAKFVECGLSYVEFDALYDEKKNISGTMFDNLNKKFIEYKLSENIFKII